MNLEEQIRNARRAHAASGGIEDTPDIEAMVAELNRHCTCQVNDIPWHDDPKCPQYEPPSNPALREAMERIEALRAALSRALMSHELIEKGVSGELKLNELYALESGGFFVTLCSDEENFSANAKTPIEAVLKAVKAWRNHEETKLPL